MIDFFTIVGIVVVVAWAYLGVALLAGYTVFRRVRGDRLLLSLNWPTSVPLTALYAVRDRWRRWRLGRRLPRAKVRR